MTRITGTVAALLLALTATGCSGIDLAELRFPGVYRATIQQGNVVTQQMIDRLRPGMTRRQVQFVLGEPVLANTFRSERWDYVYTVQVGSREREQQTLTVWFEGAALSHFEGDFLPSAVQEAREEALEAATEDAGQG